MKCCVSQSQAGAPAALFGVLKITSFIQKTNYHKEKYFFKVPFKTFSILGFKPFTELVLVWYSCLSCEFGLEPGTSLSYFHTFNSLSPIYLMLLSTSMRTKPHQSFLLILCLLVLTSFRIWFSTGSLFLVWNHQQYGNVFRSMKKQWKSLQIKVWCLKKLQE